MARIFREISTVLATMLILMTGVGKGPSPDRLANETGNIHADASWVADGARGDALPVRRCQKITHSDIFLDAGSVLSSAPFVHPVIVSSDGKQALAVMKIRCAATPGTYKVFSNLVVRGGGKTLGLIHVLSQAEEDALAGVGNDLVVARGKMRMVQVRPCDTVKRIYPFADFSNPPTSGLTLHSEVFVHGAQVWDGVNSGIALIKIRCNVKPGIYNVIASSDGQSYGGMGSNYLVEKFEVVGSHHPKVATHSASTGSLLGRFPTTLAVGSATARGSATGKFPTTLAVGSTAAIFLGAALTFIGLRRRSRRSEIPSSSA